MLMLICFNFRHWNFWCSQDWWQRLQHHLLPLLQCSVVGAEAEPLHRVFFEWEHHWRRSPRARYFEALDVNNSYKFELDSGIRHFWNQVLPKIKKYYEEKCLTNIWLFQKHENLSETKIFLKMSTVSSNSKVGPSKTSLKERRLKSFVSKTKQKLYNYFYHKTHKTVNQPKKLGDLRGKKVCNT